MDGTEVILVFRSNLRRTAELSKFLFCLCFGFWHQDTQKQARSSCGLKLLQVYIVLLFFVRGCSLKALC